MRPSILVFSLLVGFGASLPENTEQKGIDQGLLDRLHFFSQFAAASYWPGNTNSTGDLLKCSGNSCPSVPAGNCPDVEKGEYMTASEWKDIATFDGHGFIAVSNSDQLIVLAFRGTDSNQNWAEDLKFDTVDVPELCKSCKVHHGFWESWGGVSKQVVQSVVKIHEDHPDYRVAVVGHSLGGAEAIIAAGVIRNQGKWWADNVELYSYGSPRVGNSHTVEFLSKQSTKSHRVTAMKDPIPRLPPSLLGYEHTSPEYWIHSKPDSPGPGDVNMLLGFTNSKGVNQFSSFNGFDMNDHRHYFGFITGCDPSSPKALRARSFGGNL